MSGEEMTMDTDRGFIYPGGWEKPIAICLSTETMIGGEFGI